MTDSGAGAPAASETISATLMRTDETPATIESVVESNPNVRVIETPSFVRLEADGRFEVDVADIADRLGREFHLADWMVGLSSYVGRVHVEGDRVAFTAEMLQFGSQED